MNILYADTPEGYAAWLDAWEHSAGREPFAHPGYAALYASESTRACAALFASGSTAVLYPFLLRRLAGEPFYPEGSRRDASDIITPYGYGGPVLVAYAPHPYGHSLKPELNTVAGQAEKPHAIHGFETLLEYFYQAFVRWAQAAGVVCEFVRFALHSKAHLAYPGLVEHNNDNIVCALTHDEGAMLASVRHKVRKNLRIATAHGLTVEEDAEGLRLDDFTEVYYDTMQRRRAEPLYYFSRSYFTALKAALKTQARWFHVMHQGRVVASELLLCSGDTVYSFLGGTHKAYYKMRAGDLLKFRIMERMAAEGFRQYVIGGGYRPHDGIFAFKKSFAPQGVVPFYTGKQVFDKEMYRQLTGHEEAGAGYFPAYRK